MTFIEFHKIFLFQLKHLLSIRYHEERNTTITCKTLFLRSNIVITSIEVCLKFYKSIFKPFFVVSKTQCFGLYWNKGFVWSKVEGKPNYGKACNEMHYHMWKPRKFRLVFRRMESIGKGFMKIGWVFLKM